MTKELLEKRCKKLEQALSALLKDRLLFGRISRADRDKMERLLKGSHVRKA